MVTQNDPYPNNPLTHCTLTVSLRNVRNTQSHTFNAVADAFGLSALDPMRLRVYECGLHTQVLLLLLARAWD